MESQAFSEKAYNEQFGAIMKFCKIEAEQPSMVVRFRKKWFRPAEWNSDEANGLSRCAGEYMLFHLPKRSIFAKLVKNKLEYLYDSVSLINDWEKNDFKNFSAFSTVDPNIYLHLAASYYREYRTTSYGLLRMLQALERFIIENSDMKGEKILVTISGISGLFPMSEEAYHLFISAYLRLGMTGEAARINELFGGYFNDGMACLLRDNYVAAAENFLKSVELESQFSDKEGNKSAAYCNLSIGMGRWRKCKFQGAHDSFKETAKFFKDIADEKKYRLAEYLAECAKNKEKAQNMSSLMKLCGKWEGEVLMKDAKKLLKDLGKEDKNRLSGEINKAFHEISSKSGETEGLLTPRRLRELIDRSETKAKGSEEKAEYEEDIDLKDEDYRYNLLGLEIDYINKEPIVYFDLLFKNKKPKERKLIFNFSKSEKNFALLTRLAVAVKTGKKREPEQPGYNGWLAINDEEGKFAKWCLYLRRQGVEDFRKFLSGCNIFGLKEDEKRQLVRTKKKFAQVRLAIPAKNIDINLKNLKNFASRFTGAKGDSYPTGVQRVQSLIRDAIESYKKFS